MTKLKTHAMWSIHNLIAHPASEIFYLLSCICYKHTLRNVSHWIHDITIPEHKIGEGRG